MYANYNYTIYSRTAVNNADYSSVIQPLTFTTTTDVGDVSVLISEDEISESLENFFADLSLLTNTDRVTIAPAEATVEIVDNDGECDYCKTIR